MVEEKDDDVSSETHGEKRKGNGQNGGQFSLFLSGLRKPGNI